MKRIISATLASVMLVGTLFSCATVNDDGVLFDSRISTASSDADEYAVWLTDRLEAVPEDIVLGIGSDNTYGVDMSSFEDDGYVIKRNSDGVVIFGKTGDGLDRGVRKYANLTEDGEVIENVTYHEGYRIERFVLFGADIADYAIEYPADANENVKFAVSELQNLIKKACGAELSAYSGNADSLRKIIFRTTDDASLRYDGYRYFEENGNLVIEGAVKRGCMWGVYRFLENECGWDHLTFGTSYLNETDLLEIPAGLSETETPAFDYVDDSPDEYKYAFVNERSVPTAAQNSYGVIEKASHGITSYPWFGTTGNYSGFGHTQPCFSNPSNLDWVYENVCVWLESQEKVGRLWGREIQFIDMSQGDSSEYCMCSRCCEIYAYDKSYIGPMIGFANELAEMLEPDYANMKIQLFGYFETVIPPAVTRPTDAVYITYAPNGNCCKHALNEGELCQNETYHKRNNAEFGGYLDEWCAMSDNVYVWYYCWGLYPKSYTMLNVFYEDMKWFAEIGVRGIFINRMDFTYDTLHLTDYMLRDLNWDPDKTEEEFEEYLAELMEHVYGDGWEAVREVEKLQYESQLKSDACINIWHYGSIVPPEGTYDPFWYATVFDQIIEYMDYAIERADSETALHYCRMYMIGLIYMGCTGEYFSAYDAEDTERLEWLQEQYSRIFDIIEAEQFDPEDTAETNHPRLPLFLEELMWTHFKDDRDRYTAVGATQRPAPDWVSESSTVTA